MLGSRESGPAKDLNGILFGQFQATRPYLCGGVCDCGASERICLGPMGISKRQLLFAKGKSHLCGGRLCEQHKKNNKLI